MNIKGRTAVVVGGASGLGEATARLLAKKGACVFIFDRELPQAEQVAKEINGNAFYADVTDNSSLKQAFCACEDLAVVVNTAGICLAERILGKEGIASLEHFQKTMDVNLVGSFNVLRLGAEKLALQTPLSPDGERGVLINTASIAAYEGQVGQAAYSASKAGVIGMTLPIARELKRLGIRVMTIAPGVFETPMMAGLGEKVTTALSDSVPFPARLGIPDEYALLVAHIIENTYLNGETIRLDAALRLT
jgi:3-hydroxyacyl-CoA dehydrogenase/3-hydroxy-2-methylbutyryl-CoA dehydrogenase